jgi:hypothetical protein
MIPYTDIAVKLTFTYPVLGSWPSSPDLLKEHILSKAPDFVPQEVPEPPTKEEVDASVEEQVNKGTTVFPKDTTGLHFKSYQIRGFLKETLITLAEKGIPCLEGLNRYNFKRIVDGDIFVLPDEAYLHGPDGQIIKETSRRLDRPIRVTTMQGDHVAIARSELLEAGTWLECTIRILDNNKAKAKVKITEECILTALEYGQYKGLSQWRNGSFGRFKYEVIKK